MWFGVHTDGVSDQGTGCVIICNSFHFSFFRVTVITAISLALEPQLTRHVCLIGRVVEAG